MSDPCPICHGAGFLRMVDTNGELAWDSNGNPIYRDCICKIRKEAERKARELRAMSGISDAVFDRLTFDAFRPEQAVQPTCDMVGIKRQCEEYAANPRGWLVMMGPYGTGKTHLAYAIAGELLRHMVPVYAASVPEMLGMIRSGFRDAQGMTAEERLSSLRTVEVLVLDDWGTEKASDWVTETMFTVLNSRYNEQKATVLTTNLKPGELVKKDPRLASRIFDNQLSRRLVFQAGDYRQRRV